MRLAVVVAAIVALALTTGHGDLLIVILAIVAMIMLHELGHFATAKWAGMKVTEYFLGFGPRLWSVRRGETEYGIKAIPAGGYVKILGMTNLEPVPAEDEARTYRQAPFWRRFSVAVAGSTMHFILAFVLLWSVFALVGTPTTNEVVVTSLSRAPHGTTPAQRAGLEPGDVVVSVDGHTITSFGQLSSEIKGSANRTLTVVVDRNGHDLTLHVTPVPASSLAGAPSNPALSKAPIGSQGEVGIGLGSQLGPPLVRSNPISAVAQGGSEFGHIVSSSIVGLGQIFSPHGISSYVGQLVSPPAGSTISKGQAAPPADNNRLMSIVGAARIATQAAHAGTGDLLLVLADINIFIGIVNLFPLLPLDGGHVVIAVYERLRSRRGRHYHADAAKLLPATYAMFIFLIIVGVSAFYLDIAHPLPNIFG
jgi:membrane-associated protease RseP (regulator of RpoE activity)